MSIGVIVVIVAVLFVLGNIMGLKPKMSEVRVGDMRMFARKIDLHPKTGCHARLAKTAQRERAGQADK